LELGIVWDLVSRQLAACPPTGGDQPTGWLGIWDFMHVGAGRAVPGHSKESYG